jgi:hypothetical protein
VVVNPGPRYRVAPRGHRHGPPPGVAHGPRWRRPPVVVHYHYQGRGHAGAWPVPVYAPIPVPRPYGPYHGPHYGPAPATGSVHGVANIGFVVDGFWFGFGGRF